MIEVIWWISIILLWFVTGCNVVVMIRMKRLSKALDNQVQIWRARNVHEEEIENENV